MYVRCKCCGYPTKVEVISIPLSPGRDSVCIEVAPGTNCYSDSAKNAIYLATFLWESVSGEFVDNLVEELQRLESA